MVRMLSSLTWWMRMRIANLALLAGLTLPTYPAVVRDRGYCPDIASPECRVRDFYRGSMFENGTEAYWLQNTNGQVCFVPRNVYIRAIEGNTVDCEWKDRRP